MSQEKKSRPVLDLPCDSERFIKGQANWEDAEDQLSAIQRLIEEGLFPEEKARIVDEKFQARFESTLFMELQLKYYEALERAKPEIAIVGEFLPLYENKVGALASPILLQKILELQKYCDDLLLIRNETGLWQAYHILEEAAEKITQLDFHVAAACLTLFVKNSCEFEIAHQFIYDLLKVIDKVLQANAFVNQESKNRSRDDFKKMQVLIETLKIFYNQLDFSKDHDEKLDARRNKFQTASPTANIRFFKAGQDTNGILQQLQEISEILAEVGQLIKLNPAEKKVSKLKFTDADFKALWGKGRIAKLKEKYFIPLEQAKVTLRHADDSLGDVAEIIQKSDSSDPDIIQQRSRIPELKKQYKTLCQECEAERSKRSFIFLKEAIKELTIFPSDHEFIMDCIFIFLNERKGNFILSTEAEEVLKLIGGVEMAYGIFKRLKKEQYKDNPQEFDIVIKTMDEPFNQLMAYSRKLSQKSLPSSNYSLV
ncbi:MAG TPA: hypothetical protein VHE99_05770 [Gammaproteobacteria bacterium]|nr:hypothetical protein [Gammaproteobacteria bacterium]